MSRTRPSKPPGRQVGLVGETKQKKKRFTCDTDAGKGPQHPKGVLTSRPLPQVADFLVGGRMGVHNNLLRSLGRGE